MCFIELVYKMSLNLYVFGVLNFFHSGSPADVDTRVWKGTVFRKKML